jgi:superfamily I DNA/RNA helicase
LIVDEGQDLLNIKYFPIFDKLLKKGLYNGNWMFFYDSNQNLFNRNRFDKAMEALQRYYPIKYRLTKNCRNTEPISLFNKHISGIESGNAIVDGENVNIISCDEIGFDNELDSLISTLIESGVKQSEIVMLSPVLFENSVIAEYEGKYKAIITKFSGDFSICNINYATIQSYKGLDSKVVIAVDIHKENLEDKSILLYTLLSRARTLLYILSDRETEKELKYKVLMNL